MEDGTPLQLEIDRLFKIDPSTSDELSLLPTGNMGGSVTLETLQRLRSAWNHYLLRLRVNPDLPPPSRSTRSETEWTSDYVVNFFATALLHSFPATDRQHKVALFLCDQDLLACHSDPPPSTPARPREDVDSDSESKETARLASTSGAGLARAPPTSGLSQATAKKLKKARKLTAEEANCLRIPSDLGLSISCASLDRCAFLSLLFVGKLPWLSSHPN